MRCEIINAIEANPDEIPKDQDDGFSGFNLSDAIEELSDEYEELWDHDQEDE